LVEAVAAAPVRGDPPALGYRPALDGVRALAVLLVVAVHVTYVLVPEWTDRWVPGGFLGVDVFFVLSGFLITTLLLEEHGRSGTVSLRAFYGRRAVRLLPAVFALLLVHGVLAAAAHADLHLELRTAAAVAFYAMNWVLAAGGKVSAGLGHLWSLGIEEQFYLVWPLLLLVALGRRRPTRAIVAIALVGIAWATGIRAWLWLHDAGWDRIYVRTDARIDELLIGVLLAVGFRAGWRVPRQWRHAGAGGLVLLLVFSVVARRDSGWLYVASGFTAVGLAAAALIASLLEPDAPLRRVFAWPPAVRLGRMSYSLYLWHVPIFSVVADRLAGRPPAERLVAGMVGATVATMASYHLVERPMLRLRRRAALRPAGEAAPMPADQTAPEPVLPLRRQVDPVS